MLAQLDRAVADVDLVHAEDGLAILAAPGEHQVWSFGRTAPARVVPSDTLSPAAASPPRCATGHSANEKRPGQEVQPGRVS